MLTVTFLAFEVELCSQPGIYALSKLAAVSEYLLGIGNIFVASGWVHCCLDSLIGALTFGIGRFPLEPGNAFVAGLIATVLLMPAIFLQGDSHNQVYGIIAFAAFGAYAGALMGVTSGQYIARRPSFQAAWCVVFIAFPRIIIQKGTREVNKKNKTLLAVAATVIFATLRDRRPGRWNSFL